MKPTDVDEYLKVLASNNVGSAVLEFADGFKLSVVLAPPMPAMPGGEPPPGGWKKPAAQLAHLDNPEDLREYTGELP